MSWIYSDIDTLIDCYQTSEEVAEGMDEFREAYGELAGSRLLYMSMNELKEGIPRWRLQVFEHGTAPQGGDILLLCLEKPTKEECLREGTEKLKELIRQQRSRKPDWRWREGMAGCKVV